MAGVLEESASTIEKPTKAAVPAWAKRASDDDVATGPAEETKPLEEAAGASKLSVASKPSTASWLPRTAMTKLPSETKPADATAAETMAVTVATSTSANEIKSWTVKSEGDKAVDSPSLQPVGAETSGKKKIRQQVPGFAI